MRARLLTRAGLTRLEKAADTMLLAVVRRDSVALIGDVMHHWVRSVHRQGEAEVVFPLTITARATRPRPPCRFCASASSSSARTGSSDGATAATPRRPG